MKRQYAFPGVFFALLIAFSGCVPSTQSIQTPASALVRVECRNASREQILQVLRSARGKDITVSVDAVGMLITAAFSPAETPVDRLLQVLQELNGLNGVMRVEVVENPRPIRESF